jgi:hypothetical protein
VKFSISYFTTFAACVMILSGCATYQAQKVDTTSILLAQKEIAEDQLLDVGIAVFKSKELSAQEAEQEGTSNDIRKAEGNFIPEHLKNTLQRTGHWGAVRVVPGEDNSVDLVVTGEILESNGEYLGLKIAVIDAAGRTWLSKNYRQQATEASYTGNQPGQKDAFQDLYNTIANEMVQFKRKLSPDAIKKIRTTARLKFAQEFAPDAFSGYLAKDKNNTLAIRRLPADDDPMMQRLLKIREREYMYVDTLNERYDAFYRQMWPSYENWRQLNLTERLALQKIKREALTRQLVGALMVAAGVMGAASDSNFGAIGAGMIILGGQVIISGFNVSKEAQLNEAAIGELSESFGSEMKPVVMELEGKQYELTGSAEEQFKQWKALLRKIYFAETGFEPVPALQNGTTKPVEEP